MDNKIYDILKYVAMIVMPAVIALVGSIFNIWHLPYGVEITETLAAINACLGAILGVSSAQYNKAVAEAVSNVPEPEDANEDD